MLMMRYGGLLEKPEDTVSFTCSDCERSQTFCVALDSQIGLLNLLPHRDRRSLTLHLIYKSTCLAWLRLCTFHYLPLN